MENTDPENRKETKENYSETKDEQKENNETVSIHPESRLVLKEVGNKVVRRETSETPKKEAPKLPSTSDIQSPVRDSTPSALEKCLLREITEGVWSVQFKPNAVDTEEQVKEMFKVADLFAIARDDPTTLLCTLRDACGLAVNHLSPEKCFQTLERCSSLLYQHFLTFAEINFSSVKEIDAVLKSFEDLRNFPTTLENVDKPRSVKVTVEFHLCSCAFDFAIGQWERSNITVKEVKKLLQTHFKSNYKRMSLFGQANFLLARYFFLMKKREYSDSCLKQSFDTFYSINNSSSSDYASIADLYNLPLVDFLQIDMLTAAFQKYVYINLAIRSKSPMSKFEVFLNVAVQLWIAHLLGKSGNLAFKRNQKDILKMDLETPPTEIQKPVIMAIRNLISAKVILNNLEFNKKLIKYAMDLCLLQKHIFVKFVLLNNLALAVQIAENFSECPDQCLNLFQTFLHEVENEPLFSKCYWMRHMLCNAHLYLCSFFASLSNYDSCIEYAENVIETTDIGENEWKQHLLTAKAIAYYIRTYSYYHKGEIEEAIKFNDKEISFLKTLETKCFLRMQAALNHKDFLQKLKLNRAPAVPRGLIRLRGVFN